MSRVIDVSDPSKLTDEDIRYLQERDKLPEGVAPLMEPGLVQMGLGENVGQVPTGAPEGGSSIPDPATPDRPSHEEPDLLTEEVSYEAASVKELKAEVDRRNAERDSDNQLAKPGKKAELVAVLVADDEAAGDDDDDVIVEES